MTYEIQWDDGDPTGRVQPVHLVALNRIPDPEEIFVGQKVFFPQGDYSGTEGNNTGGKRYHEGVITRIDGKHPNTVYSGHHYRGEADGKWVTYRGYSFEFSCKLQDLRIAPNVYNVLMASRS